MTIIITKPLKVRIVDDFLECDEFGEFIFESDSTLTISFNNIPNSSVLVMDPGDWALYICGIENG